MHYTAGTTMMSTAAVIWTRAKCPAPCNRIVMVIPGPRIVETRLILESHQRSGRGRICRCEQCGNLVEVIEHG
jgi:hypothetical protein